MKNVCLTNDSINCTNVTNAVPPVTCETLDAVKCIQVDQAACNSVITQGISQIKDLLTDGVSCSLTSGGGPVNLEPLAQLIGTSTNCIGNNICGTVLGKQNLTMLDTTKIKGSLERMEGTINKIILNLGQDKDTIDGQTTVLSELSNLEGLVKEVISSTNSTNSGGSCDLSSITNSIGTYPGGSVVGNTRGFDSLFKVIGHTADSMLGAADDGSLMAKSNALIESKYLKCSDFSTFVNALDKNLNDIFDLVYYLATQPNANYPAQGNGTNLLDANIATTINGSSYDTLLVACQ